MGNFLLQLSLLHVASVEQDRWRSWWTLQEISGCVFHSELVEEVVARLRMSWTGDASPAVQNAMGFANMEFPTGVGGVIDWPCFCGAPGTRGLVGHWRTPSTHLDWVPEKQQKRVACEFFEAKFPWCEIWHDGVKTEDMRTACVVLLSWIASFLSVDLWCCGSTRGQVKWLHLGKGLGQRADVQGWFFFFSSWLSEKNSRLAHFFVEAAGDDRLEGLSWRDGVGQDRTVLDLGAMRVQEWDGWRMNHVDDVVWILDDGGLSQWGLPIAKPTRPWKWGVDWRDRLFCCWFSGHPGFQIPWIMDSDVIQILGMNHLGPVFLDSAFPWTGVPLDLTQFDSLDSFGTSSTILSSFW
jgi:hypothetical protein